MKELETIMYNKKNNNNPKQFSQYNNRTHKDIKTSFSNDKIIHSNKNEI